MKPKIAKQIISNNTAAYDQIGTHFSATRQYNWAELKKVTEKYLKPNSSILDLGCGNGRLLSILPDNINYLGLDISKSLIKESEKYAQKFRKENQEIFFQTSNLLHLKKIKNKYNYIFAIASLHHIPSDKLRFQVCQNIFSLLKPNGLFICTNWQLNQPKYQSYCNFTKINFPNLDQNDCLIPWKNSQRQILAQRYYHCFSETEIYQLLSSTKFEILENYTERYNIITISRKK